MAQIMFIVNLADDHCNVEPLSEKIEFHDQSSLEDTYYMSRSDLPQ